MSCRDLKRYLDNEDWSGIGIGDSKLQMNLDEVTLNALHALGLSTKSRAPNSWHMCSGGEIIFWQY